MFGSNFFGGRDMFGQTTNARHYLVDAFAGNRTKERKDRRWRDQSFPEYIVDVTRNSLLSLTTSLTKVSSQAHDFFARMSAALAFERMMRSCMGWFMPGFAAPSPMGAMGMDAVATMPMGLAISQMWGIPGTLSSGPQFAPMQQPKAPTWFGAELFALPKPEPKPAPRAVAADLPVYGALFALPAAFFAMAPSLMQAWNVAV
jgi:hypothetical protein